MQKLFKFLIILLLLFNIFSISASVTVADSAPIVPGAPINADDKGGSNYQTGSYTLNDMTGVAVKISTFILGIVGSLALLAFVVGGMMWMLSAGNPEWVTRGKQTIIGAVVGLAIVFTSYMIIQLVYSALGVPGADRGGWSISSWFNKNSQQPSDIYYP